ncbi:LOW QUALITY PROTEIN: eukaryotic translation initiation factor 1A [Malus domestica]|uniref:LOW QUALITY PROTEIN: eukaryotic translation initiation factor 1A n=1 Tax=Malus domestica TaxID=3750 RepID=UPI0039753592
MTNTDLFARPNDGGRKSSGPPAKQLIFEFEYLILLWLQNKGKGGKNRKRGKNEADDEKRELVFKEDGQEYAQVLRMLGNGRCEAMCIDGTKRLCHIRGKMHKKVWIAAGDIILVGLRDYRSQDDKADVILKYMPDEARLLKAYGELPENTRLNEGIAGGIDDEETEGGVDDYIEFEDEDIDKI